MKIVLFIIGAALLILSIFTAVNWSVLTTSTPLSFIVYEFEGPLGVILLGIMLGLVILVVVYALLLRTAGLVESRRLNRQLDEQRALAERAESSRIKTLQESVERGFEEIRSMAADSGESVMKRFEDLEQSVTQKVEDTTNSIMAHLGYLDDKLKGGD